MGAALTVSVANPSAGERGDRTATRMAGLADRRPTLPNSERWPFGYLCSVLAYSFVVKFASLRPGAFRHIVVAHAASGDRIGKRLRMASEL